MQLISQNLSRAKFCSQWLGNLVFDRNGETTPLGIPKGAPNLEKRERKLPETELQKVSRMTPRRSPEKDLGGTGELCGAQVKNHILRKTWLKLWENFISSS